MSVSFGVGAEMIKILIADDHAIIRRGLTQIVGDESDMEVVGEAENAQQAIDFIRQQHCDVVVLDINMPGRSGLDLLKEIRRERPGLPVLVLSVHPEEQYGVRVLKAGAAGYISKESAPELLVQAIRKAYRGGRYVSESLAEKLVFDLGSDRDQPAHAALSDREYEVMRMIASGKTVSEIAAILSLSVKTVSTYRARVLNKLNLKNSAELTYYVIQNRLLD